MSLIPTSENVELLVPSEMFQDKIITQNLIQSRFQITLTPIFLQKHISENACNSSSLSGLFRAHCFNRDRGLFCKSAFRKLSYREILAVCFFVSGKEYELLKAIKFSMGWFHPLNQNYPRQTPSSTDWWNSIRVIDSLKLGLTWLLSWSWADDEACFIERQSQTSSEKLYPIPTALCHSTFARYKVSF